MVYSWHSNADSSSRWRITYVNENIKAFTIALIDEDGSSLGEMKRYDALNLAQERELDLVQLSYDPVQKISTAKLMDYGKHLYDQKKKRQKQQQHQKKTGMKQVKFSYSVDDNDLLLKVKQAEKFLEQGYSVRVSVKLRGRENIYSERAVEKLIFFKNELAEVAKTQTTHPKQERNTYSYIFIRAHK